MNPEVIKKIAGCIFILLISVASKSQTSELPDISADRPGMATPPSIAIPTYFQVETGFSFEKNNLKKPFQENIYYNSMLIRYGINKNTEIRVQTDYARLKTDSESITGFDPLTIGTKIFISETHGILPKTSLLLNLTLPCFGEKSFRPENLAPSIYLLMQNDISDKFNLCYNIGIEYDGGIATPSDFTAICMGYSITDNLSAFAENYDWFSKGTKPEYYFDLGISCLIGKNVQLDVSGNLSLQNVKNYFMVNAGVSWRIAK